MDTERRCISLTYDCLTIQFIMSKATLFLLEGKWEVGQNLLKPVILWIR